MRILFLIVLIAGLLLGIVYPWAVSNGSGYEFGRFPVYDRESGFRSVTVRLSPEEAPIRVLVDMTSIGAMTLSGETTVLTLTAATGGRTVLNSTLTFAHQEPRNDSPQAGGLIYRDVAGLIMEPENADYVFTLGLGGRDDIEIRSVELELRASAIEYDPRVVPVGYMLMVIGVVGFVLAFRRRRTSAVRKPEPPKWGRGE